MTTTDVPRPRRRSIRLRDYDYSEAGAYFITVCAQDRRSLFGTIDDAAMHLNACGEIVQAAWEDLPNHYPHITLDVFVVMPNHIHGVIIIVHPDDVTAVGAGLNPPLRGVIRFRRSCEGSRRSPRAESTNGERRRARRSGSGTTTSTSFGVRRTCVGSRSTS